jgi:hypothetical protein
MVRPFSARVDEVLIDDKPALTADNFATVQILVPGN